MDDTAVTVEGLRCIMRRHDVRNNTAMADNLSDEDLQALLDAGYNSWKKLQAGSLDDYLKILYAGPACVVYSDTRPTDDIDIPGLEALSRFLNKLFRRQTVTYTAMELDAKSD